MENQELINEVCKILIDKKIYVDMNIIVTVFSYLGRETIGDIICDLKTIKD